MEHPHMTQMTQYGGYSFQGYTPFHENCSLAIRDNLLM